MDIADTGTSTLVIIFYYRFAWTKPSMDGKYNLIIVVVMFYNVSI